MSSTEDTSHAGFTQTTDAALTRYIERHPEEASTRLAKFPLQEIGEVCALLPAATSAKLLANLPDSLSDKLVLTAPIETLAAWLTQSNPDDAIAIASRVSLRQRKLLLKVEAANRVLTERLNHTRNSGFSNLLLVDFLRVGMEATLDELVAELKRRKNTAHRSIFVVDASGRYKGIIELSRALTADPHRKARELLRPAQPVLLTDSLTQALRCASWNLYRELPVVDEQQRLIASLQWRDLQSQLSKNVLGDKDVQGSESIFEQGLDLTARLLTTLVDTIAIRGRNS